MHRRSIARHRVRFLVGDVQALPTADATFDRTLSGLVMRLVGIEPEPCARWFA